MRSCDKSNIHKKEIELIEFWFLSNYYLFDYWFTPNFLVSPLQMKFVRNVTEWVEKKPVIYHGHTAYLDFSRYVYTNKAFTYTITALARYVR